MYIDRAWVESRPNPSGGYTLASAVRTSEALVLTAYVRVELPDRCADRAAGQLFRAELDRTAALASEAIRRLEARSGPPEPSNPANGL